VQAYRLYRLDGAGRFSAAEWIKAEDDSGALAAARAIDRSGPCELWQGNRLIARIDIDLPELDES